MKLPRNRTQDVPVVGFRVLVCLDVMILLLVGCAHLRVADPPSRSANVTAPTSQAFRIVAYATEAIDEARIPFEKLTHINYSFLIPNSNGTFRPLKDPAKLTRIAEAAHSNNVCICISVGGWGPDPQFEAMAASPDTRTVFVSNVVQVLREHHLDGVDMDWEYPDPGQSSLNFLALVQELRAALPRKILTTAVVSHGDRNGLGIPAESFPYFDFMNVMTYDGPDHGTMEQFKNGLSYWTTRGVPKEKLVMGVPFYSRVKGSPGQSVTYAKLVAADSAAAKTDTCRYDGATQSYNGIPTIEEKTRIALQSASGIMFWVLNADAPGDLSLVNAIYQVARK